MYLYLFNLILYDYHIYIVVITIILLYNHLSVSLLFPIKIFGEYFITFNNENHH